MWAEEGECNILLVAKQPSVLLWDGRIGSNHVARFLDDVIPANRIIHINLLCCHLIFYERHLKNIIANKIKINVRLIKNKFHCQNQEAAIFAGFC